MKFRVKVEVNVFTSSINQVIKEIQSHIMTKKKNLSREPEDCGGCAHATVCSCVVCISAKNRESGIHNGNVNENMSINNRISTVRQGRVQIVFSRAF